MLVLNSAGIIKREKRNNPYKQYIANITNRDNLTGSLEYALHDADVLIGVSGKANLVKKEMISDMADDPVSFALTNPEPEIMPEEAKKGGARVIATGRSDYDNK